MIKKIIEKVPKSFFRFLLIGGSATIIDFIIYMVISNFLDISLSKVLSTSIASIYSFILNKKWTFVDESNLSKIQVIKYVCVQLINITVNTTINTLVFKLTNLKIVAFVIATGISMMVNYLLQKFFVFKSKK